MTRRSKYFCGHGPKIEECATGKECAANGCRKLKPDSSYSELIENVGVLDKAQKLVDGRDKQDHYGPPEESMRRIGLIWSGILGVDVSAEQVALMMLGLKTARLSIDPKHEDSLVDAGGYVRILERLKASA